MKQILRHHHLLINPRYGLVLVLLVLALLGIVATVRVHAEERVSIVATMPLSKHAYHIRSNQLAVGKIYFAPRTSNQHTPEFVIKDGDATLTMRYSQSTVKPPPPEVISPQSSTESDFLLYRQVRPGIDIKYTPLHTGVKNAGQYYSGQTDDVRIYNYALTDGQVKMIHNNGAVSFQ